MHDRSRKIPTVLGATIGCLMLLHIVLALFVIVMPEASRGNRVLGFYRRFVVLGPFFQESRIVTSPHLLVSKLEEGRWSKGTDFACLEVAHAASSKNESLQRQSFENFLADRAAREKRGDRVSRAVGELENYLRSRPAFTHSDSLAVAYIHQHAAGTTVHVDTVYQHKFKR